MTISTWRKIHDKDGNWIIAPKVGDVLFHKELLGINAVTHEAVHAATCFLRILDKLKLGDQIDDNEELLAYCVGSIAGQIVNRIYHLKIL